MTAITLYKQIHPTHCSLLANLGFKTLINLRFDGESQQQPTTQAIAKDAIQAGLHYHHLPFSEDLTLGMVSHFAKLIQRSPKPVMVFCGSGSRAKRIYQSAKILGLLGE